MNDCYLTKRKSKGFGGNALCEGPQPPRRNWHRAVPAAGNLPEIPVTLICVDTTDRVDLAARAIRESLSQAKFSAVKLLTHESNYPNSIKIPRLTGMSDYSRFMIRDLHRYVDTSHCLIVQWDGYVCDSTRWTPEFLKYDYIGAPWYQWYGLVGNGGFSLRSRKLLQILSKTTDDPHPEDSYICMKHRKSLEEQGIRFAPTDLAGRFAIEARNYDNATKSWQGVPRFWNDHFGFHSFLTPLPDNMDRPLVFHHGGDYGDVIYSLPVIKAMGGGILFLSPDNRYPWPRRPHASVDNHWVGNIAPFLNQQPYIWQAMHTGGMPFSVDFDLNAFREYYKTLTPNCFRNIMALHLEKFKVSYNERNPWLTVDKAVSIPGRPIVVNRTPRYHNDSFPWFELIERYRDKMVFIGSNEEYEYFKGFSPHKLVPHQATPNLLDVARVVAGCKVLIGNQSCAMAIALGLGKRVVQEVWLENKNCMLDRPDSAIYWKSGACPTIPDNWLI